MGRTTISIIMKLAESARQFQGIEKYPKAFAK